MKWWYLLLLEILIVFGVMAWIYFFPNAESVDDFAKSFLGFVLIYSIETFRKHNR